MLAQVLQTLQLSIIGGMLARPLVPRTPVLARVLQTLQMSIFGGIRARILVPRTPVLARVLQTLQMSIPGGILARPLGPRTSFLVRVLQTLQLSIQGGKSARLLVPRTPVLARVLQTLQMSIRGGIRSTSPRPKDTRARARTSNTPNVHTRRQIAHVLAFQGYPSARASTRRSNLPTAAHAPDTVPCASSSGRIPSSKVAIASTFRYRLLDLSTRLTSSSAIATSAALKRA